MKAKRLVDEKAMEKAKAKGQAGTQSEVEGTADPSVSDHRGKYL